MVTDRMVNAHIIHHIETYIYYHRLFRIIHFAIVYIGFILLFTVSKYIYVHMRLKLRI